MDAQVFNPDPHANRRGFPNVTNRFANGDAYAAQFRHLVAPNTT